MKRFVQVDRTGRVRIQQTLRKLFEQKRELSVMEAWRLMPDCVSIRSVQSACYMMAFLGAIVAMGGKGKHRRYMSREAFNDLSGDK